MPNTRELEWLFLSAIMRLSGYKLLFTEDERQIVLSESRTSVAVRMLRNDRAKEQRKQAMIRWKQRQIAIEKGLPIPPELALRHNLTKPRLEPQPKPQYGANGANCTDSSGEAKRAQTDWMMRDWSRLQSEDEAVVKMAKASIRAHVTLLVSANRRERDWVSNETKEGDDIVAPKVEPGPEPAEEEETGSNGLADDY
jgi:hypothetical protein